MKMPKIEVLSKKARFQHQAWHSMDLLGQRPIKIHYKKRETISPHGTGIGNSIIAILAHHYWRKKSEGFGVPLDLTRNQYLTVRRIHKLAVAWIKQWKRMIPSILKLSLRITVVARGNILSYLRVNRLKKNIVIRENAKFLKIKYLHLNSNSQNSSMKLLDQWNLLLTKLERLNWKI